MDGPRRDGKLTSQMPYSRAWEVSAGGRMGSQGGSWGASAPLCTEFYLGMIGGFQGHPKTTWLFYDLASEVTSRHFYHTLLVQP